MNSINLSKYIYAEKATKFCEVSALLLTICSTAVKSKVEIPQNFVAFSEYMNFILLTVGASVLEHVVQYHTKFVQGRYSIVVSHPQQSIVLLGKILIESKLGLNSSQFWGVLRQLLLQGTKQQYLSEERQMISKKYNWKNKQFYSETSIFLNCIYKCKLISKHVNNRFMLPTLNIWFRIGK